MANKLILAPLIFIIVVLGAGCAATKEGMTVATSVAEQPNPQMTSRFHVVNVKGNTLVSPDILKESINDSLRIAGLYSTADGSIAIDADLWKLDTSLDMGAGLLLYSEYVAEINYKLYRKNAVLRNIGVSNKASVSIAEMPIGEVRAQKAREKAVRGNIEKFLTELTK